MDVWAADAEDAAWKARDAQVRPDSIANVFDVTDEHGTTTRVDLQELLESKESKDDE
jgi:hypothetical protein